MFARLQTFHQPAGGLDELTGRVREAFAAGPPPAGLDRFLFMVDRAHDKALLISFWDAEEDLRRLEAHNTAARERFAEQTGMESPAAEVFEVTLGSAPGDGA